MTPGTPAHLSRRINLDMIEEPVAYQLHPCPPPDSVHHPLSLSLGQQLTHVLQSSTNPTTGLLTLTQVLGELFLADACFISVQERHPLPVQVPVQAIQWYSGDDPTIAQLPAAFQTLLTHLAPQQSSALPRPLILAQVHLPQEEQPASLLVSQTVFQGHVNGMIWLVRRHRPSSTTSIPPWLESDGQRLGLLTSQVAGAIAQFRTDHRLQQQLHYQAVIERLTAAVSSSRDIEHIYKIALEGAVSATEVSQGFILMLKYANPLQKKWTSQGPPKARAIVEAEWTNFAINETIDTPLLSLPALPQSRLKESLWISECVVLQQLFADPLQPIILPNCSSLKECNSPVVDGSSTASLFSLPVMPALLLVPIENQGTILGGFVLQHQHPRGWQPEEIAFVKLIAAQLSNAIIQNRTLRQVQSLVDERTAQLQRSLDVQAKLYEKTRQQVAQLRRLNQIMEEFLSTMSHELLTPLTSMTLAIRMLRQANLSPEQQQRYLDILERQCAQETNLINDLLALQRLESGATEMDFQPLDIRHPIRDLTQSFEETWARKRLTLKLALPDRPLQVCTDLDSLNRILQELLTNAGKYAAPNTTVQLSVNHRLHQQSSQVVVTLCNRGAGISDEEMPYIFDKFRRGQGATQQAVPGTGLGLALVKGLVEHLSGAIAASSAPVAPGSWETNFTLILPQSIDQPI